MTRIYNSENVLLSYLVTPAEIQQGDKYGYKVVAVIYNSPFWAAYRGLSDWSAEQVANEGDKISEEVATALFPALAVGRVYNV